VLTRIFFFIKVLFLQFLTIEYVPPFWGDNDLPGEDTDGETPVPIPNTEAKLVRPMVVLRGESRYRQDYEGLFRKEQAFAFL
jgi:hypothetical protein